MSLRGNLRRLYKRIIRHIFNWGTNTLLFWGAAALLLGGVIHIVVILSLPYLATRNAWVRLLDVTAVNHMQTMPPVQSGKLLLPLMAPDIRYAICRYDVRDGPLKIRARLLDDYWSVAIYTRLGENFYMISGKDVRRNQVELILSKDKIKKPGDPLKKPGDDNADDDEQVSVIAPDEQGLILVRAPLLGDSFEERAEQSLKQAVCQPVNTILLPQRPKRRLSSAQLSPPAARR